MRLGLLTSGGDCAGLNAVIRAVVKRAVLGYGWQVLGIRQATHGLLSRPVDAHRADAGQRRRHPAPRRHPARHHQSRRSVRLSEPMPAPVDRSAEIAAGYHELGLDALIGVGGDGSLGDPAPARRARPTGTWSASPRPSTTTSATPSARSASAPRSRSRPRRSTGCTSPPPATAGSWCSRSWAAMPATSRWPPGSPAAPTSS